MSPDLCPVAAVQPLELLSSSASWRRSMLVDGGWMSSPEVGANVGPCSQMQYIKNKATQLLTIKDLRPSNHYLLWDIMIFRRRSWRTYLHHLDKQIQVRIHEIQKIINNDHITVVYLYSYFININKHPWYLCYFVNFGLSEGENARVTQEWLQSSVSPDLCPVAAKPMGVHAGS